MTPCHSQLDLLPFAISYAIWIYNLLPPHGADLSAEELLTGTKS